MSSQIEIVNVALSRISQRPITSLTENSVQADAVNAVWTMALRECLRGNNWSFATVVEPLGLVSYTPFNYQYAYAYPGNALIIFKVYNEYTTDLKKGEDFRELFVPSLNQKVIVTDCPLAYCEFTYLVKDTTVFDDCFANVLAYRLAADLAMPLNADPEQAINMTKIFVTQMSEAQRMSSYETRVKNGDSPTVLIDSRVNAGGSTSISIGNKVFDDYNRNLI